MLHGVSKESGAWDICKSGFGTVGITDDGYFGKGFFLEKINK